MIDLLKHLFATPEAERDPADWATRFLAHLGLGVIVTVLLIAVLPMKWALAVSMIAYTIWEAMQYRAAPQDKRTAALRWDGVLDLVAWTCGAVIVGNASAGLIGYAALVTLAALIVIGAGVAKRSKG